MTVEEIKREYHRQYRKENAEKIRENHRRWRRENVDKVRKYNEKYWERKAAGHIQTASDAQK